MNFRTFKYILGILTILFIISLFLGCGRSIFFGNVLNCTDGTLYNQCSNDKPYYCNNGTLIKDSSICGCPYDYRVKENDCELILRCNDRTVYDKCSNKKPLFCLNGNLINKASKCGCSGDDVPSGDDCISKYMTNPKNVNFEYILRGQHSTIPHTVYGGLNTYLSSLQREIYYSQGQAPPTDIDFLMRSLNEDKQRPMVNLLVEKIRSITSNRDDQARIAISLVQNIPYDYKGLNTGNINGKYPYEVMYTESGVCSEKAQLLVYLLRELGYGVAILRFNVENHDAIGIKCQQPYSFQNTGYCFVESTSPSIITDSSGDYVGAGKLESTPKVLKVSDGNSLDSVSEEYNDAVTFNTILGMGQVLDKYNYDKWFSLVNKYGMPTK